MDYFPYFKNCHYRTFKYLILLFFWGILASCQHDDAPAAQAGLKLSFSHTVNGQALVTDQMNYMNAAGNTWEVTELMYFISDVQLYHNNGEIVKPANWDDIHYVDIHYPATLSWSMPGPIPAGNYDSLTFTFGIRSEANQSFMFVNPPEVNMAWPDVLGGGYHYLMLNGWWKDTADQRRPFNFHLGKGQVYAGEQGDVSTISGFIDNSFTVNPGGGPFVIANTGAEATLTMDINSWFETPVVYDHNVFGGAIMQNQQAMHTGCLNGRDAFTLNWKNKAGL